MTGTSGYSLQREITGVLLDENPGLSGEELRKAGGGVVTLVLSVEKPKKMRLFRLSRDLRFHSRHSAARVVAVTMPTEDGPAWEVLPLPYLQGLADEAVVLKTQLRLEAALRPRVR